MSIRKHADDQLAGIIEAQEEEVAGLNEANLGLSHQIGDLNKLIDANDAAVKRLERRSEWLVRARLILQGAPPKTLRLFRKVRDLKKKASDDTISVAENRKLAGQIAAAQEALKGSCPHPYILYVEGYEGSSSYDYDDAHRGELGCVVCGLHAYSEDFDFTSSTFPNDGTRVFNRLYNDLDHAGIPYKKAKDIGFRKRFQEYLDQPTWNALQDMFTWPRVLKEIKAGLKYAKEVPGEKTAVLDRDEVTKTAG